MFLGVASELRFLVVYLRALSRLSDRVLSPASHSTFNEKGYSDTTPLAVILLAFSYFPTLLATAVSNCIV